jgi:hypothetical protein
MNPVNLRIPRPVCGFLLILCGIVITYAIFYQPEEVNYYLPKNVISDLQSVETNACGFI